MNSVETRHLKVEQHDFDRLETHTLARGVWRLHLVVSGSYLNHLNGCVERLFAIDAEFTILGLTQLTHLLLQHLDIDQLVLRNDDVYTFLLQRIHNLKLSIIRVFARIVSLVAAFNYDEFRFLDDFVWLVFIVNDFFDYFHFGH